MTFNGYLQIGFYLVVLIALAKPLGLYMARVYLAQLRKKLEDDLANPKLFHTESGIGYRLAVNE